MNCLHTLEARIAAKTATVGIYGLGYVGLPLALRFAEAGLKVIGFDIDPEKVDLLNAGQSYIERLTPGIIQRGRDQGFEATTDFARTRQVDAIVICVPTPLDAHRAPDLSFIVNTIDAALPHMHAGQLVSLESTTWPGTTDEVLAPRLRARGLVPGDNCALVFSPEREDPGNPNFDTSTIPKVVGGDSPASQQAGVALYSAFIDTVVPVSSTRAAEMVKLLENIYRAVNIGLVNELKIVAQGMGLDIFEVINAAATKPFGFKAFYPGPGIGGHCIPIDPFYLTWKAREYGIHTRFIELAGEVNAAMPDYVFRKTLEALSARGIAMSNARLLVLGIAYKRDVDDVRESPSVQLMEILRQWGARIDYSDSNVPVFPVMREHSFDLASVPLTPGTLAVYDAVLVLTDHSDVDYDMLRQHARLIIDARGRYSGVTDPKIVQA